MVYVDDIVYYSFQVAFCKTIRVSYSPVYFDAASNAFTSIE